MNVLCYSENESPVPPAPANISEKTRFIERKLQEASARGQKPGVGAIAQGFQPSQKSLATQVKHIFYSFLKITFAQSRMRLRMRTIQLKHSQHCTPILQQDQPMVIYPNFRMYSFVFFNHYLFDLF